MNELHDINRFPSQSGIIVFPISMSKISNAQNAQKCFEYLKIFIPKIVKPMVGLNFIYSGGLYLNSDKKANELKRKYETLAHSHKFEFMKIIEKHPQYIPNSFSFQTWEQTLLNSKGYYTYLGAIKDRYDSDEQFKSFVHQDIESNKKEIEENQINFILEEICLLYMISKGQTRLQNDYVQDAQKWILQCYPGKPLLSEAYLYQNNFLNHTDTSNPYHASYYDLLEQKVYDFEKIEIDLLMPS